MKHRIKDIKQDNYNTSPERSRDVLDKLSLGSSFYFNLQFIAKLLKNRKVAKAGQFDTENWVNGSLRILDLIERCGGKFEISGLQNINTINEPVVFISNHMGILETMVFPGIIAARKEVTFVVKSSLETHPIFGPVMKARKPITVERKDPIVDFKKVMTDGLENLKNNTSVVIFPQSKRDLIFDPKKFNKLGIKLAKKAGVHVVPVAIKTDFWQNGKLVKDIGPIYRDKPIKIKFGTPIKIDGQGNKEHLQVIDFIQENLQNWDN